jgi:hypothetical protein|tara:strand:+ start:1122 stop:1370 length:249 start_codon:yes stop_codon:yes gene_type:complete
MEDLIRALLIFLKYGNPELPTHCEHHVMLVSVHPDIVSKDDKEKLKELGFEPSKLEFHSFKFGKSDHETDCVLLTEENNEQK